MIFSLIYYTMTCVRIRYFHILSFILFLITTFHTVRGNDDDDDNIIGEIVIDLMVGVGMSICEQYATCQAFMTIIAIMSLVFLCFACLAGELTAGDICNTRNGRRAATVGVGYGMARRYR